MEYSSTEQLNYNYTIAGISTPIGKGGICIIRISGNHAYHIIYKISDLQDKVLEPRKATYTNIYNSAGVQIDTGIIIYYKGPHSFTGEDIIEIQGHGSPVIAHQILETIMFHGARLSTPGEFSKRAFLNGKIDLIQAESIAELIDSETVATSRLALRTLQGEFSKVIKNLRLSLIDIRIYLETNIDFSEEEINLLERDQLQFLINSALSICKDILVKAKRGYNSKQTIKIVIAGRANVGKSTLMNCLSGRDTSIVTSISGTTRDIIRESITINGIQVEFIDTAGLEQTIDLVESIGIEKAYKVIENADVILWVYDLSREDTYSIDSKFSKLENVIFVANKDDIFVEDSDKFNSNDIRISASKEYGIDKLIDRILQVSHFTIPTDADFSAKLRHIECIQGVEHCLIEATELNTNNLYIDLIADEIRIAIQHLAALTGEYFTEDMLDDIFSKFCIGK